MGTHVSTRRQRHSNAKCCCNSTNTNGVACQRRAARVAQITKCNQMLDGGIQSQTFSGHCWKERAGCRTSEMLQSLEIIKQELYWIRTMLAAGPSTMLLLWEAVLRPFLETQSHCKTQISHIQVLHVNVVRRVTPTKGQRPEDNMSCRNHSGMLVACNAASTEEWQESTTVAKNLNGKFNRPSGVLQRCRMNSQRKALVSGQSARCTTGIFKMDTKLFQARSDP